MQEMSLLFHPVITMKATAQKPIRGMNEFHEMLLLKIQVQN